jgi:uncharacterized protein (TIGR02246 family)
MYAYGHWHKVLVRAAISLAAIVAEFTAGSGTARADEPIVQVPSSHDPATVADEKIIKKNQTDYVQAFNAGDAKALAAYWAPDGEFVDAEGTTFRGRNAIEKEFGEFFATSKGMKLEISMDSLRFIAPGVALESGSSRVVGGPDGATARAAYHIVHAKKDGKWFLTSVREAPYAPASNYEHLRDLEWLVGNWTVKADGKVLDMSCEWTAKRSFLLRKYSVKGADGTTKAGVQIIGWDPLDGGIRGWVFDSDGGFGSERWQRDGKRWLLEASGVSKDGAQIVATNVLTGLDHDNFSWQSVGRSLNGVALPDTAAVKVTRVKSK